MTMIFIEPIKLTQNHLRFEVLKKSTQADIKSNNKKVS